MEGRLLTTLPAGNIALYVDSIQVLPLSVGPSNIFLLKDKEYQSLGIFLDPKFRYNPKLDRYAKRPDISYFGLQRQSIISLIAYHPSNTVLSCVPQILSRLAEDKEKQRIQVIDGVAASIRLDKGVSKFGRLDIENSSNGFLRAIILTPYA